MSGICLQKIKALEDREVSRSVGEANLAISQQFLKAGDGHSAFGRLFFQVLYIFEIFRSKSQSTKKSNFPKKVAGFAPGMLMRNLMSVVSLFFCR